MNTERIPSVILGCNDLVNADPFDAERTLMAGTLQDLKSALEDALSAVYMTIDLQRAGWNPSSRQLALTSRASRDFQLFNQRQNEIRSFHYR